MDIKEIATLVSHCCSYCCRAADLGSHDYCGGSKNCHNCPS